MKINANKIIQYSIIIIPLVLVLTSSFFISTFYFEKVNGYFTQAKEKRINDFVKSKKAESELWLKQLKLLFEYKNARINENIEKELSTQVELAYKISSYIYKKNKKIKTKKDIQDRIIEALKNVAYNGKNKHIFITDFKGNNILSGSLKLGNKNILSFSDADSRSIILEEIQKVKKYGGGFIKSNFFKYDEPITIMVKDLKMYDWFIGASVHDSDMLASSKRFVLDMVKSVPVNNTEVLALYEGKKALYKSKEMKNLKLQKLSKDNSWYEDETRKYKYTTLYYEPFDWFLVSGFNTSIMSDKELMKYKKLETMLDNELDIILKVSVLIILFVVILSLLLSRKVNSIFKKYQDEVKQKTDDLEILNKSLEQKVQIALESHRQKDKMLIQKSKMADMGDMLSMIAHQWRQPLNQMSYVFMNIDSAYEYKELTTEYLDEKIKEGNDLLEFMSQTIEDFRNYFKPDKEKEFILVSDVVLKCIEFMKQPLSLANIEVEFSQDGRELTHIYKNEFIQVILNLLKNSRDALLQRDIENPKIVISSIASKEKLIVCIEDNAGGIDEKIIDKVFEPYFSTKDDSSGTGLGLYMSKMIIEEHIGGKLSVSNTEDGAKFIIEI